MDKIHQRKNLAVAREKVKRNRGAGGIDGGDVAAFEADLEGNLERLHVELKQGAYALQTVLQHLIPKAGKPGEFRALGIPTFIVNSTDPHTGLEITARWIDPSQVRRRPRARIIARRD